MNSNSQHDRSITVSDKVPPQVETDRGRVWASTMTGKSGEDGLVYAHSHGTISLGPVQPMEREEREERLSDSLSAGATRPTPGGNRLISEEPDKYRTCFERDRDRILHSSSFRRLAGKTQVFVFPDDHQRTRLTHALEVAQVATAIARSLRLNVALTEAIALGHDCGHGPGGHASEDALSSFVDGGYDHALWGADVVLAQLNLCSETLDGVRNHSWSRPRPETPEGIVVSWADRIAYTAHDFEDAVSAGLVQAEDLPKLVRERCGHRRASQLGAFISDLVETTSASSQIAMSEDFGTALGEFRRFNYERIYLRDESVDQAHRVIALLRGLVEYYLEHPHLIPRQPVPTTDLAAHVVAWVGGMTDRFAFERAKQHLGISSDSLPIGIDTEGI